MNIMDLSGQWLSAGNAEKPRAIFQSGRVLLIANIDTRELNKDTFRQLVIGVFRSPENIFVPDWDLDGDVSKTGDTINWSNGTTWSKADH